MRIYLFAFGKLKTPGLREAANHYQKFARTWHSIQEIELKPLTVPDKSPSTRARIQEKEGEILLARLKTEISDRAVFYLLDESGRPETTHQWAQLFQEWESSSVTTLSFCIGSSMGFSKEVRSRARGCLSLGPQTLSHELARVVLLEQLYRASSVVKGHPYHNEGS